MDVKQMINFANHVINSKIYIKSYLAGMTLEIVTVRHNSILLIFFQPLQQSVPFYTEMRSFVGGWCLSFSIQKMFKLELTLERYKLTFRLKKSDETNRFENTISVIPTIFKYRHTTQKYFFLIFDWILSYRFGLVSRLSR